MILMAPPLGIFAALILVWHAIIAGSLPFAVIALGIGLVTVSIVQSHRKRDLALLAVMSICAASWFLIGTTVQTHFLEWGARLADRTNILCGLLILIVIWIGLVYWVRHARARSKITIVTLSSPEPIQANVS